MTEKLKRPESQKYLKARMTRKSRGTTEMITAPVYWRTDAPCANYRRSRRNNNLLIIFPGFLVRCANTIGTGWFGAPLVLAHVCSALPIDTEIA
jgi:hypothetical protein